MSPLFFSSQQERPAREIANLEKKTDLGNLSEYIQKYFEFFNNPHWCPLFGDLPRIVYNPRSQAYQCYELIKDARSLWDTDPYTWLEGYPENLLKTARTIVTCHDSTTLHTTTGQVIAEHGFEHNQTLFSNFRTAIDFVKSFHRGMFFDNEIRCSEKKDYLILAVFSIAEAKGALEEILTGENEDNPHIIEQVQGAQRLLAEAQRQFKAAKSHGRGGEKRGEKKKELYREIKTHAERLREKYPHYKEEAIANTVYLERKKNGKSGPGPDRIYKILTITP